MDSMDAAGVTSITTGESEWFVIVETKKVVKLSPELITEIICNVTNEELRHVMQGTDMTLIEAMRKYVCNKVATATDEDEEPKRNFRIQNHCPRNFVHLPDDSVDIVNDAVTAFKNAEIDRIEHVPPMAAENDRIRLHLFGRRPLVFGASRQTARAIDERLVAASTYADRKAVPIALDFGSCSHSYGTRHARASTAVTTA